MSFKVLRIIQGYDDLVHGLGDGLEDHGHVGIQWRGIVGPPKEPLDCEVPTELLDEQPSLPTHEHVQEEHIASEVLLSSNEVLAKLFETHLEVLCSCKRVHFHMRDIVIHPFFESRRHVPRGARMLEISMSKNGYGHKMH